MLTINLLRKSIKSNQPIDPKLVEFYNKPQKSLLSFIGDIHNDLKSYNDLCKLSKYTLQLGDLTNSSRVTDFFKDKSPLYHKYIYGNHDWLKPDFNPPTNNLGHFGIWNQLGFGFNIGYISGANSIDKQRRLSDHFDPWHENEEMSYADLQSAIDYIVSNKPEVMVSHMAPLCAHDYLRLYAGYGLVKSRTMMALETVFSEWKPALWVFGHYHQNVSFNIENTLFICVNLNHKICIQN